MQYDLILGIDPGKYGAFVVQEVQSGKFTSKTQRPEGIRDAYHWLYMLREQRIFCGLERAVGASFDGKPRSGAAMFTYGREFGHLEAFLVILRLPHILIPPNVWTAAMHKGAYGNTAKEKSLYIAESLWPGENLRLSERARKPHDGLVDAMLIAEYTRRELLKREGVNSAG